MKKKMNLQEIKAKLENNDTFKYYRDTVGISWEDFDVIDLAKSRLIKQGSKKIGSYSIMIDEDKLSAYYDLTVDGLAEDRLKRIKKGE